MDMRDYEAADLYACGGDFSQVPKDWEVTLEIVGDEFFSNLSQKKNLDWETILGYSWRCCKGLFDLDCEKVVWTKQ
jgi:hypothetical protein